MLTIVFWNIQHLTKVMDKVAITELANLFADNLSGIAKRHDPQLIILCEGLKGLRLNMREGGICPRGYEFV